MAPTQPKSRPSSDATSRSSGGLKKKTHGSSIKALDPRNTILGKLDPSRISVQIDVDSASTASISSIPLPFPPQSTQSDPSGQYKHDGSQKKLTDEIFVAPSPRTNRVGQPALSPSRSSSSPSVAPSNTLESNTEGNEAEKKKAEEKNNEEKEDGKKKAEENEAETKKMEEQKKAKEKKAAERKEPPKRSEDSSTMSNAPSLPSTRASSIVPSSKAHHGRSSNLGDDDDVSIVDFPDIRHAFTSPSPNKTPITPQRLPHPSEPGAQDDMEMQASVDPLPAQQVALERNPIRALAQRNFRPNGALPTGFPEPRDLTKDVQGGKIPVKGQNRFSKIDVLSSSPTVYHDTSPLPPTDLLSALVPTPQILLFGDGLPYSGFLRSFSIADMTNFEWPKLIGLVSFAILPSFAPFQDEPPFFSHRTIVKQIVAMLRAAKKQDKPTTFWLAYQARSNVADVELATVLDRRIDLVPSLGFLWLSVVCQVIHMGIRAPDSHDIHTSPSPLDQPLIIFQLTSVPLPKGHVPQTIGYFPRNVDSTQPIPPQIHTPQASLFQVRLDVPIDITREVDGVEVKWHISGSLPLMLMLNGLNPDDTSTVLKELTIPRITKSFWPVIVNSAPDGYRLFDFFVPFNVLGNFYDEQPALMDMGVSIGLLDRSVKESSIIITHQPRFQKGAARKRKFPSDEVRTAIEMNPPLFRKFAFLVLLNKYDVFGMVHDPMLIQPAVQEIENLGDMMCVSAHTNARIFAKDFAREVEPPFSIVRFPPTLDTRDVLLSAAAFGPVEDHQIFQQSGLVMVKYQATQSAVASYGATLPGPVYFSSGNTSKDVNMSLVDRLEQVRLAPLPDPFLNEANLAAATNALSEFQMPDINSAHTPSPVPTAPPSVSNSSSFL